VKTLTNDCTRRGHATLALVALVALAASLCLLLATAGARAQLPDDAEPTDVVITVHNGTTRSDGRGDMVVVELLGAVRREVASGGTFTGETTLSNVPISPSRDYLTTVRYAGVDYYAKARGSELQRGPVQVYVFDTSTDREALTITGMDVIARRQGSTLKLEYIVTIENESRPQVSIVPAPATLEIVLPADASGIEAIDMRGAEATAAATVTAGRGRAGLVVPFAPGRNSIRLSYLIPMTGEVVVPIGANVTVQSWDLLAFPASLQVWGRGLEADPSSSASDAYIRYLGSPLAANQSFDVSINSSAVAQGDQETEEIFTQPAPGEAEQPDAAQDSGSGGRAAVIVPLAVVLVVALIVSRRRRRRDADDS
jgi:hypothetical protein